MRVVCTMYSLMDVMSCMCRQSMEFEIECSNDEKRRPHVCSVCEKRFTTKQSLTIHMRQHSGEEALYSCTECEKSFTSLSGLSEHKNVHSSKYKCTECEKSFTSLSGLSQHKNVHSSKSVSYTHLTLPTKRIV